MHPMRATAMLALTLLSEPWDDACVARLVGAASYG